MKQREEAEWRIFQLRLVKKIHWLLYALTLHIVNKIYIKSYIPDQQVLITISAPFTVYLDNSGTQQPALLWIRL